MVFGVWSVWYELDSAIKGEVVKVGLKLDIIVGWLHVGGEQLRAIRHDSLSWNDLV